MKLLAVVILSFVVGCCVSENRMIDEAQYKNHRLFKNDTPNLTIKYPIYPAQVYADLSKDFTSIMPPEQPKTTEAPPSDVVRMNFNTAAGKRKQNQTTTQVPTITLITSTNKTPPPPIYFVTASNFAFTPTTINDQKSPVYTPSTPSSIRETENIPLGPIFAENGSVRKPGANGTKMRRVLKSHQQQAQNLLYATTTQSLPVADNNRKTTVIAKLVSSNNASKPFTTVLVPKQALDGNYVQRDYALDDSFRPIAPPAFSYKPSIDANAIENRRASSNLVKTPQTTPTLIKYGFTKPVASTITYKVEEYKPSDTRSSSVVYDKKSNNQRDRSDQIYVQHNTPKHDIKYGFAVPESYMNTEQTYVPAVAADKSNQAKQEPSSKQELLQKNTQKYDANQGFREYYPATEVPKRDVKPYSYLPYNTAGKFDTKTSASEIPAAESAFEFEKPAETGPSKDYSSPPVNWYSPMNPNAEPSGPEVVMDDTNAKDVLKTILRDMFKSKQQNEKPSSANMDEIIDSYFKTNRPNVDFSLGNNYDIETGESN